MSTTIISKTCPKCGKVYDKKTYSGHGKVKDSDRYEYGSPIKKCPSCGHLFADRDFHEIAIEGIRKQDEKTFKTSDIVMALALIGAGLACVFGLDYAAGWFFAGLGVLIFVAGLVEAPIKRKRLEIEKAASEARMQNPSYVAALRAIGVYVPAKYLPKDSVSDAGHQ